MSKVIESMGTRVALIDDDSGLATVLERRFAALGWESQLISYAPAAEHLAPMRLHALLLNPALTGLDYIEQTAAAMPGLALLVCSDPASVADRVRALRGGADDWITKPCHPEELIARVQAVLRRRRAGDAAPEGGSVMARELLIRPARFGACAGEPSASLSPEACERGHLSG